MSKTYNIILHILAVIGAILFFTSCNDSGRDKQRAEQKKITQAIEKRIDSLQRQNERDRIWRNQ
jgi:tRNA A37 threonylcarbamoyladenosine synthetase subunit TsaC/SUA5/YrdC